MYVSMYMRKNNWHPTKDVRLLTCCDNKGSRALPVFRWKISDKASRQQMASRLMAITVNDELAEKGNQ